MITAIVLTKDEARHIERCLRSLAGVASRILVVDCGSTDETAALAANLAAEVVFHPWTNHASQFNWALENLNIVTPWVLRLDADEYLHANTGAVLPAARSAGELSAKNTTNAAT